MNSQSIMCISLHLLMLHTVGTYLHNDQLDSVRLWMLIVPEAWIMDHCESPSRGHCHKCFIKQPCIIQLSLTWIQPPGCLPWSFVQNGPPVVSRIRLVGFLVLYKIPWPDSNSIIHAFIYHIRSFHISASAVTMMDH